MSDITSTRLQALMLIDNERNRQDAKWGEQTEPQEHTCRNCKHFTDVQVAADDFYTVCAKKDEDTTTADRFCNDWEAQCL